MRIICFSDTHIDAGEANLSAPDAEYGNTRLRDHEKALRQVGEAWGGSGFCIFAGDLGRTPRPGPLVYRLAIDAFEQEPAPRHSGFYALQGNHDYLPEAEGTPVHVLAKALGGEALDRPRVLERHELQIGFLPWTPPARMFEKAPNDPKALNQLVSDTLHDVVVGMQAEIDPAKPSMLVVHWLVAGEEMPDVVRNAEPVLDPARLEAGPWDVVLAGHFHKHGRIAPRTWWIGPTLRSSFGEDDIATGFVEVEWNDDVSPQEGDVLLLDRAQRVRVRHVPIEDRELLTYEISDVGEYLASRHAAEHPWPPEWGNGTPPLNGAIARLRYTCTDEQARAMAQGPAQRLVDVLIACGALKVVGPQVTVLREERERRDAELTAETDPAAALERWIVQAEVPEDLHEAVLAEGARVMAADG